MKNKKDIILKDEAPKKSFFGKLFFNKVEQKKIMAIIKNKSVKNLLFYTDVDNVLLILDQGIKLIKEQKLDAGQEYIVWTYLENENSIGFEFDTSTRAHFWKWASDAKLDIEKIAIIGIDPKKLSDLCRKDWALDSVSNIVYVYENIPVEAIDYILIKDKHNLARIKTIIDANDMQIDVFFGEQGNLEEEKEGK